MARASALVRRGIDPERVLVDSSDCRAPTPP